MEDNIKKALEEILLELREILAEIQKEGGAENPPLPLFDPTFDKAKFFSQVRGSLFGGKLTPEQVSGMEAKLDSFISHGYSTSWGAYALATSFHETNKTMQPVREAYWLSEGWRKKNLRYYPWYGRGDVQLTWESNYKKASAKLGVDLITDPDKALDPKVSADVMSIGMKEGWFTGKSLSDYLTKDIEDATAFKQARRIINGVDKAALIAGYALKFQEALKEAGYGTTNHR